MHELSIAVALLAASGNHVLIGVLTVAVGNNGLAMIGAPIFTQYLFAGALLVIAVALGGIGRRYARG